MFCLFQFFFLGLVECRGRLSHLAYHGSHPSPSGDAVSGLLRLRSLTPSLVLPSFTERPGKHFTECNGSLLGGSMHRQLLEMCYKRVAGLPVLGTLTNSSPKTLHSVVIVFLALGLFSSLLSAGFTFCNSVSNPYQTFLGPTASFTFITMVLFVGNTQSNHLSEELAQKLYPLYPATTQQGTSHAYGYSFWLTLLVILLNVVTTVIIIFYQKARYQRKQEQRKPMESAPRDGILF
nr:clarin-3 isoform X2 [Bubalus bubalis]